ncbi:ABC transporter ATP-binding protein [Aureimonas pseudogalii]|uniref:Iron complex transport system ATP-binding protein n=1 Tax=Aureimonas pseudogalii TaxID=1744844 RepID=A0A7W6EAE5_9HYPH|nr:ABC transporter ATP-binding protein [Aureimonas pseudogalii]MBB3997641.1 iron complex transport system ATP-binding protein [Aureimonas pseudogalii]
MIRLDDVAVSRGGQPILRGVNATLEPGLVHAVIGPNGAGKTTLLRALFGDLPLSAGGIEMAGRRMGPGRLGSPFRKAWRDALAYMPQDSSADLAMTVLEVVVLGRLGRLQFHVDDETLQAAMARLDAADIAHLADREIGSLSGGQRQMAMFAQVLMRDPLALLLDEPVSALDLKHQIALLDVVRGETRATERVTVVVLHDLNLACRYADNLLVVADGTLRASGPPRSLVTPDLIGSVYGVEVEVLHDSRGSPVVQPMGRAAASAASRRQMAAQ